jgi:uncharacterized protein GlcG (DUF336 family)
VLSLTEASDIVDAALSKARELQLRPLSITVLDPGGHPVVVKREDGAGILRPQIAHAKAWGCLGTGSGGAAGARHATPRPVLLRCPGGHLRGSHRVVAGRRADPGCGGEPAGLDRGQR